jgi:acylglycerol lipase
MENFSEYYLESTGNIKVAVRFYTPAEYPRKAILIIHGFGEHGGRFEKVTGYFRGNNYLAVTVDLRGNGKSEGNRGDASNYDFLLDDIKVANDKIDESYPGIETIIYAHSFGCNVALSYCIKNCKKINSIIMASPWIFDQNKTRFLLNTVVWMGSKLFPKLSFSTGVKGGHLSDNEELIEQYRNDPLKHKRITLRLFYQANKAGRQALHELCNLKIPVLIMFGSNDTISSSNIIKNTIVMKSLKEIGITTKTWEGAYHELHTWSNNELVFNYIMEWIENSDK